MDTLLKIKDTTITTNQKEEKEEEAVITLPKPELQVEKEEVKTEKAFIYWFKNGCNKCWENSTLQVLFHIPEFKQLY